MNYDEHKKPRYPVFESTLFDGLRQLWFPAEFRIAVPKPTLKPIGNLKEEPGNEPKPSGQATIENLVSDQCIAKLATCFWYVKTKHFKRRWENEDTSDDDPRVRTTLGRLSKGIDALTEGGIELHDPTNKRYRSGSEGMMRPIHFQPTTGLTFEKVTETVTPVIYREGRLIQPGEVFVAVPKEETSPTSSLSGPSEEK
ncbi:MAG: hypothetical protein ACRER2_04150 [Methylococcales bacterium]